MGAGRALVIFLVGNGPPDARAFSHMDLAAKGLRRMHNEDWGFDSNCFVCEPRTDGGVQIPFDHDVERQVMIATFNLGGGSPGLRATCMEASRSPYWMKPWRGQPLLWEGSSLSPR